MKALILAGGKGKRLSQIAKNTPKALIKIGSKPVIEHQIILLRKYGVKEIWILLGYLGNQIREYLQNGEKWNVNIHYHQEKKPLGTAGALRTVENEIKKDFLEEAKNKIILDVSTINDKSKKILKYLESRGVGLAVNEICMKALFYPSGTGGYSKIVNDSMKELSTILIAEKVSNGKCFGRLKQRISFLLKDNEATEQEIENLYNHIIMELLGGKNE